MQIRWAACYAGGEVINQIQPDGTETSYDKLDHARIAAFSLWDFDSRRPILTLHLEPGQRLIYRRRVEMKTGQEKPVEVCYLAGWRRTVNGECIQSIAYVFESTGRVELGGRFDPKHPWFYAPVLRPWEE